MSTAPGHARVWDVPTRLFHWSLAAAFAGDWLTRDARYLELHEFAGYAIGVLLAFRLAWGFAGTRWARFASFPLSGAAALSYLLALARGRHPRHAGHNPAGSVAIYGLLALAAAEVVTGIVTLGAEKREGPLAGALGYRAGDVAHDVHLALAYAMLALVAIHVAGVVVGSLADRENLARAMVTGRKRHAARDEAVPARGGVALVLCAVLAAGAAAYFGEPSLSPSAGRIPQPALAMDAAWKRECSDCHLAYHPSLLPARSWTRTFAEQHAHFGEDLGLADETLRGLLAFALAHPAEAMESPLAWKMASTVPASEAPLRITQTAYWKERHARLAADVWKRVPASDCGACHADAEAGTFAPRAIRVDPARVAQRKAR